MTIEQRLDQLEKRYKRLTVALTMMAVVMCAVVTVAATGLKDGEFDMVTVRHISVMNAVGEIVVVLGSTPVDGNGLITVQSAEGKGMVTMATMGDNGGWVSIYNNTGEEIIELRADEYGNGKVGAYNRKGKGRTLAATGEKISEFDTVVARRIWVMNDANDLLVTLNANDFGDGAVTTYQPNGKTLVELGANPNGGIVDVYADEYGNGVVGAWNRKGKGRTLQPGP